MQPQQMNDSLGTRVAKATRENPRENKWKQPDQDSQALTCQPVQEAQVARQDESDLEQDLDHSSKHNKTRDGQQDQERKRQFNDVIHQCFELVPPYRPEVQERTERIRDWLCFVMIAHRLSSTIKSLDDSSKPRIGRIANNVERHV
eukprot:762162-Hanusia_phi.AAC.1